MHDRRSFLKTLALGAAGVAAAPLIAPVQALAAQVMAPGGTMPLHAELQRGPYELHVRDYYDKMRHFDAPSDDDVVLTGEHRAVMHSSLERIKRLVRTVGYGNFALLGFDEAIHLAQQYPAIGPFTHNELEFLECQFYADAAVYGFYGLKAISHLTAVVRETDVIKVPYSGNYLFRGAPHQTWLTIRDTLGENVVLTSGVRGVMKQFYLFLNKAAQHNGNLSLASRSLAPPGYSFHGVSDFDVGQRGYGEDNFTARFTETPVFQRLEDMGYLTLRYPRDNTLGVRFEPWHVKVMQA